jgi:hypothetical protein
MLRSFVCAVVGLALVAGTGLGQADKKTPDKPAPKKAAKSTSVKGKIDSVDAEKGTIKLTVGKKGSTETKEFTVAKDTKIVGTSGRKLKDGLKNKRVAKGTSVTVATDSSGKVTKVTVGAAAKKSGTKKTESSSNEKKS